MAKHPSHLLDLAKRGAEVRMRELAREARTLLDLFPHLGDSFDADELPVQFIIAEGARRAARGEHARGAMSAAARRAASDRMTKYWAARRKGEQK